MKNLKRPISLLLAILFTTFVLDAGMRGIGPLPPLGAAFNPSTGVWKMAANARLPHAETIKISGLRDPVTVTFDTQGTAYVHAKTAHDLFMAIGYLQATNRLFQMDLMRRQGEGLLSQVVGPAALSSDKFELQLGLLRTARAEWLAMPPNGAAKKALIAYAAGVNALIRHDEAQGTLPTMFKLLGYRPALWTPIDSLVIEGDMTQSLDFSTAPLEYALLSRSIGYQKTMTWFPIIAPNIQHPYDPGPYHKEPPAPIEPQTLTQGPGALIGGVPSGTLSLGPSAATAALSRPAKTGTVPSATPASFTSAQGQAVKTVLAEIQAIPSPLIHTFSDSNNWAVSGTKTANGQAMMAGDPHLEQTLPSIWYQIAGKAPGYNFSGVSIPGLPVILIGHNQNIAWSLTNVQNQATLFYHEDTSSGHPNQYFWKGAWHAMREVHYSIPVKGQANAPLTVKLTVHGPIMTQSGQTMAVDWMGALPSADIQSMLDIIQSQNFQEFRQALRMWHAPTQNFIYADSHGNIGMISAGYYPLTAHGKPWLPLSGTGHSDIIGTIPYNAIPQSYNPPSHLVFSANQREVTPQYPYYIGTSMDFFSTGFRADEIYTTLVQARHLTPASFQTLQNNTQDYLAKHMVPELLTALQTHPLNGTELAAESLLKGWTGTMSATAPQGSIWWTFINRYVLDTFGPWWSLDKVPVTEDANLALGTTQTTSNAFVDDLEAWTRHDPNNAAFSLPDGTHRTANTVMAEAFQQTVQILTKKLGPHPAQWQWGKLHFRQFPSLTQVSSLGYGPRPSSGDTWTVNAADGGYVSHAGPSWRMIVNWQGPGKVPFAEGVYPGGQSENPLSPWYTNQISAWWNGHYYPMQSLTKVRKQPGSITWTLAP